MKKHQAIGCQPRPRSNFVDLRVPPLRVRNQNLRTEVPVGLKEAPISARARRPFGGGIRDLCRFLSSHAAPAQRHDIEMAPVLLRRVSTITTNCPRIT